MTWRDFIILITAKERNELNEWRRTRSLAYMIYASNTGEKAMMMINWWPLPGDEREQKGEPLSIEETKKAMLALANKFSKVKN